ncbi:MAG: inorganic phosphate transporter [Dactylosporangium sp.]|nr:inorganic phosphate transporter [Dactylosporangium sp.]NNJ61831.1 inorganic phosphate transporter [Dactylosporangium sp.]
MSPEFIAAVIVIATAMLFDYTNGFHDAANAIATSVSTRALTPRTALAVAAVGNLVGAFLGKGVAETVGKGLVTLPTGVTSLGVVFAGVLGAVCWNLTTWYFGLPSSSSHALFGGLVGAALFASGGVIHWVTILEKIVIPMVLSPLVGVFAGFFVMLGVLWLFRHGNPSRLNRGFRMAQSCSALAMAVGHGMQDAAKTMGIIVLALYTGGFQDSRTHIPWWVFFTSATVLALGTYSGGWRIIRTLGRRVINLGPPEGFAAETVASSILYFNALVLHAPISTTHTITSAIMGVGATKRLSGVRWGVAGNIVGAWVLTFPAAGLIACGVYLIVKPLFG